jgi:hypothetical protein
MLLSADVHVFADHKNLTFDTLKTQCMLCWHTKIEEFSPMLHYIKGPRNILDNNLSRFHCLVTPVQIAEGKKLVEPTEVSNEEEDKSYFFDQEYFGLYDDDVWEYIECYLNLPDTPHPDKNPLNYACENILIGISLCYDSAFAHKMKFSIFEFPENFLEISCRDLTTFALFATLLITLII